MTIPPDIGRRLRDARAAAHLTVEEVASLLMMAPHVLRMLEHGKGTPTEPQAEALARIYGVSVPWLLQGDASAPPLGETPVTPLRR